MQTTPGFELADHTLGIVGLGTIGSRIAGYAKAFDRHIVAWSPHLDGARATELG